MIKFEDTIELPEADNVVDDGQMDPSVNQSVTLSPEQVSSQLSLLVQSLMDALPDDVVVHARRAIAEADNGSAIDALLFAAIRARVQVSAIEHAVLAECVAATGGAASLLDYLSIEDQGRPLLFEFITGPAAVGIVPDPEAEVAPPLPDDPQADAVDALVLPELEDDDEVLGVWRAWRYPATGASWPPPRPFYLVEAADDEAALDVLDRFYGPQAAPITDQDPLIEVYVTGNDIPGLHRAIQFAGALVASDLEAREFIFADVFDGLPGEDGTPQDLVTVDDETAQRMLTYLMAGKPLMMADAAGDDLLSPGSVGVVPLHLRTDGLWVWSDASAYYLNEHRIAPPREFREYLAGVNDVPEPVSDVALHQAIAWLQAE